MKKRNLFALMLCFVIVSSCSTKSQEEVKEYQIPVASAAKPLCLSEISSKVSFIPLESNDNILIGRVKAPFKDDSLIFLSDYQQKKVFVFTQEGQFKNTIASYGKGAGEVLELSCVFLDTANHQIELLDNRSAKRVAYSYDGKLISEEKAPFAHNFAKIDKTTYVTYRSYSDSGMVNIINSSPRHKESYLKSDIYFRGMMSMGSFHFFSVDSDGAVSFLTYFDPYVYSIHKGKISKKYYLNFGSYAMSSSSRLPLSSSVKERSDDLLSSKYASFYHSYIESESHIFFSYSNKPRACYALIDKKVGTVVTFSRLAFHRNHCGIVPRGTLVGNQLLAEVNAASLIESIDKMSVEDRTDMFVEMPKLEILYQKISKSDNPILIEIDLN